jgi:hypothetical protein
VWGVYSRGDFSRQHRKWNFFAKDSRTGNKLLKYIIKRHFHLPVILAKTKSATPFDWTSALSLPYSYGEERREPQRGLGH